MLINLINTALIACGMAVNTTNFNSEEKPYKRNAAQQININKTFEQIGQTYSYQKDNDTNDYRHIDLQKFVITNNQNTIYYNEISTIVNTTYVVRERYQNQTINALYVFSFYKIINYYDSYLSFNIIQETQINTSPYQTYWNVQYRNFADGNDIDDYLDLTTNMTTYDTIKQALTDTNAETITTNNGTLYDQPQTQVLNFGTSLIELAPKEVVGVLLFTSYYSELSNTNIGMPQLTNFNISGSILVPDNVYNIVDVPSLMLTVLTLPFSFISQAFNLTIFPGTPYQINFSNLFRTIVAIFILLWIIKKIFK